MFSSNRQANSSISSLQEVSIGHQLHIDCEFPPPFLNAFCIVVEATTNSTPISVVLFSSVELGLNSIAREERRRGFDDDEEGLTRGLVYYLEWGLSTYSKIGSSLYFSGWECSFFFTPKFKRIVTWAKRKQRAFEDPKGKGTVYEQQRSPPFVSLHAFTNFPRRDLQKSNFSFPSPRTFENTMMLSSPVFGCFDACPEAPEISIIFSQCSMNCHCIVHGAKWFTTLITVRSVSRETEKIRYSH